jgi:molybdate transport system substrate-binding protein
MAVATSLREIALELRDDLAARANPIEIEMTFGASSALARQLALGAPIDVLVSADAEILDALAERDLVDAESEIEVARGRLALVARAGSRFEREGLSAGLQALSDPSLERIAIPARSVPLGRYAWAWLQSQGLADGLEGKIVSTEHARATLAAVDHGHCDLALVYESDARLGRHIFVLTHIDPSTYPAIRYVAARTTEARACRGVEQALLAWKNAGTQTRLAAAGFLVSDPGSGHP